jgi:sugar lactone lactonase YvrE
MRPPIIDPENDPARYPTRPPEKRSHWPVLLGLFAVMAMLAIGGGVCVWWWFSDHEKSLAAASHRAAMLAAHEAAAKSGAAANLKLQVANLGGGNGSGNAAGAGNDTVPVGPVVFGKLSGVAGIAGGGQVARVNGVSSPVNARLVTPYGVGMDANGNVYVADMSGALHRITPDGLVGATSAGTFAGPIGTATEANGNIIVADWQTNSVNRLSPDGTTSTTLASGATSPILSNPTSVATDAKGDIYVASNDNNTIVMIAPDGTVTTYAGTIGQSGAADGTTGNALFNKPRGLATDAEGDVFVADEGNSNIREIMPDGTVVTLAGGTSPGSADGVGTQASFNAPRGLAVDSNGIIYVADTNNDDIREIKPDGTVTTVAGTPGQAGDLDGPANQALFNEPRGVSVDASGNIYVTDSGNGVVRMISPSGKVTTVVSPPPN